MNSLVMLSILLKLIFSDKTNLIYDIIKKHSIYFQYYI